jgi:hypothetical protein
MRYAVLAGLLCSLLGAGCTQYIIGVRTFDVKGKPVMESVSIAVEGKYIAGYRDARNKKEPVLREFFVMREFTYGESAFGVRGLPETFKVSCDAPGFRKLVAGVRRVEESDGYISYQVVNANSPYSSSDVRVKKRGDTIYVDAFLLQMQRKRYGPGY